jgi:hypothetical protein
MVALGDSFTVVALLGGICLSAWAMILSIALVFPGKAQHARTRLVKRPWLSFFTGLLLWLTVGVVGFGMIASPLPIGKLMGWTVLMALLSIAAVGSAGLVTLASERLQALALDLTPYAAVTKSAAMIVVAGLVPVLGWFLIVPFLVFASTGAGIQALMLKERQAADMPRFMP